MGSASEQDVLEDRIQLIRQRDRRFSRNAYYFVLDSLDYTMSNLGRDRLTGEERHVGGRELLAGIREYAADHFGAMAPIVFTRWGIASTEDFGEIVFNLIDAELLSRRPQDSRLDFVDCYDISAVFEQKLREDLDRISTLGAR